MKPIHTLAFLTSVLVVLAFVGWLMPRDGLAVAGLTVRFPAPQDLMRRPEAPKVDMDAILALATDEEKGSGPAPAKAIEQLDARSVLHYPNGDHRALHGIFAALEKASSRSRPLRVIHYGDSQIEGDRITSYLRNKLQARFGGGGPGLVAVVDPVPSFTVKRQHSSNWGRFSVMKHRNLPGGQNRFGAMSVFSRYTPVLEPGSPPDSVAQTATFSLKPLAKGFKTLKNIQVARLYYGWHRAPVELSLAGDGHVLTHEVVPPADHLLIREWRFERPPSSVQLTLHGPDSPDIYGLSLESRGGVCVDNIGTRGAAGYEFGRSNQALLQRMYDDLDVGLLILQYGGNVVPGMKSAKMANRYGQDLGKQIARFRKMIPGVSIIVIGPGDMATKVGDRYETRPWLEDVNRSLREQALAQGAVYWDMYAAMGGRNSMVSWVAADPPLAATDYTHFSPRGSRKVGELFWKAFSRDFDAWKAGS